MTELRPGHRLPQCAAVWDERLCSEVAPSHRHCNVHITTTTRCLDVVRQHTSTLLNHTSSQLHTSDSEMALTPDLQQPPHLITNNTLISSASNTTFLAHYRITYQSSFVLKEVEAENQMVMWQS